MPDPPLAAIVAGGRSTRFGSPKALAELRGRTLLDRVREALSLVDAAPVLIADDEAAFHEFGLRIRPDAVPGSGPLGGIIAAIEWARSEGRFGALCVACDTPLLPAALLRHLAVRARVSAGRIVVAEGPDGLEPLCAVYPAAAAGPLRARLQRRERVLHAAIRALDPVVVGLDEISGFGDPHSIFLNVNTPGELTRAERLLDEAPE
jgi:molybdenum cofactor guanylyltransferase